MQCNEDCFDGVDNDADGLLDCQDDDCWHFVECCDADGDGFDRNEDSAAGVTATTRRCWGRRCIPAPEIPNVLDRP